MTGTNLPYHWFGDNRQDEIVQAHLGSSIFSQFPPPALAPAKRGFEDG